MIFGEVLFDRFPDGVAVLGGAPFNVAWNLQAFGRLPILISRIGRDELGRRIQDEMAAWGLDTSMLQLDSSHPTGTVDVSIHEGDPQYEIVAGSAYDFIEPSDFDSITDASLIYHGSLAMRSARTRESFARLVEDTGLPRFLDVNLRAPWWRAEDINALIAGASWVKLNEHELGSLDPNHHSSDWSADSLRRTFGLQAVILTRGSRGAVYVAETESFSVEPAASAAAIDTVGAGDAFASVVLLGLLEKWPVTVTLQRAQEFASGVVGLRGATIQDRAFYERYADAWGLA